MDIHEFNADEVTKKISQGKKYIEELLQGMTEAERLKGDFDILIRHKE